MRFELCIPAVDSHNCKYQDLNQRGRSPLWIFLFLHTSIFWKYNYHIVCENALIVDEIKKDKNLIPRVVLSLHGFDGDTFPRINLEIQYY